MSGPLVDILLILSLLFSFPCHLQVHFMSPYIMYTLPTDQLFNLDFQFKSVFNLEFQAKFGIQHGIPTLMGLNLGECTHELGGTRSL